MAAAVDSPITLLRHLRPRTAHTVASSRDRLLLGTLPERPLRRRNDGRANGNFGRQAAGREPDNLAESGLAASGSSVVEADAHFSVT